MSRYRQAKDSLNEQVLSQLEREAQAEGETLTPRLRESLRHEAAGIVEEFERLAHSQNFWHGVWQSFVGSLLVLLALALFALLIYGFKQNPFKVLTDDSTPRPAARP